MRCSQIRKHKFNDKILCVCAVDNFKSDDVFDFTVTHMPKSLHTDADTQTKTKKGFQNPTQQKHKNVKLTKACTRMAQVPYVGWSDS